MEVIWEIWEASGRHPGEPSGAIWGHVEASARHLGASGVLEGKCAKTIVFFSHK